MKIRYILILGMLFSAPLSADSSKPVRLGWQTPWATQGQLVMGLQHTNIPELIGLDLEFIGFAYGGPLNRAALANEVDVLLTADQPAFVLLSKNPNFQIVSRMMYNRVCVYVPPFSEIQSLAQLSGKTIMGPVGAAAERVAMAGIQNEGVDLSSLRSGKLDMAQQSALLKTTGSDRDWGEVDALYGFDPLPAVFEEQGNARMLYCDKVVSVVVATKEMIRDRPTQLKQFLTGFALSWINYASNPEEMNQIFSEQSRLNVSQAVLDNAASIEPNRWVSDPGGMDFSFSEEDMKVFDQTNRFLIDRGILDSPIHMEDAINLTLMQQVTSNMDHLIDLSGKIEIQKNP